MSFPINILVPNGPNDPADDQVIMRQNTANTAGFLAVDHVPAGAIGNGFHKQVTYNDFASPGSFLDPSSIAYTAAGVANVNHPQHYFKNSQAVFPLSAIRAFMVFTGASNPTPPTILNSWNIAYTSRTINSFTFTLTTNCINSDDAAVIINAASGNIPSYSLTGGVLTLTGLNTGRFSVVVLQI